MEVTDKQKQAILLLLNHSEGGGFPTMATVEKILEVGRKVNSDFPILAGLSEFYKDMYE